jgi:hypothetical protein
MRTEERQVNEQRQVKLEEEPVVVVRNVLDVALMRASLTFSPLLADATDTS